MLSIGISGKRYIRQEEVALVKQKLKIYIDEILLSHKTNKFIGVTSLAVGADSIFADLVINTYGQQLCAVLPFEKQEYTKDFTGIEADTLQKYLQLSQKVITVRDALPVSQEERNNGYLQAGIYVVEHATEMLFVWDGIHPAGEGGTADIMAYSYERNDAAEQRIVKVSPRAKHSLNDTLDSLFNRNNNAAIRYRNRHKQTWKLTLLMGWLAVTIFAINIGYNLEGLWGWLTTTFEFIFILFVMVLVLLAKRKNFHGNYLRERMRTEQLRLLKYFYHAGMSIKISSFTIHGDKELTKIVDEVNRSADDMRYKSKWYANYVIKSLIAEQRKYHLEKIRSIGIKHNRTEKLNFAIGIFFALNITLHFCFATAHYFEWFHTPERVEQLTTLFSIFLPATYAAIEGVLFFQDWEVIQKYSISANNSLLDCLKVLPAGLSESDPEKGYLLQLETLNLICSIMLSDNKNWHGVLADKSNYHWVV